MFRLINLFSFYDYFGKSSSLCLSQALSTLFQNLIRGFLIVQLLSKFQENAHQLIGIFLELATQRFPDDEINLQ